MNETKENQMEFKELRLADFEIKQDGETNVFEGYASTFENTDSVGDIIERGAFTNSIAKRLPKMLWQHRADKPIGIYTEIREDERGLFVKGKLANTTLGNEAAELARMGAIDSMSIGFSIVNDEYDRNNKTRTIKELNLYEISLVTFPANEQAKITSAKNDLPQTERQFEKFLRDAGFSKKQSVAITAAGFKADDSHRDDESEASKAALADLQQTFNKILKGLNNE